MAPPIGLEPMTYRLHLSLCFHKAWTISSPCRQRVGMTILGALVSSLYGAPRTVRGSHGIGMFACANLAFTVIPTSFNLALTRKLRVIF